MQHPSTASSKIFNATTYELKLLLRGILIPACLISFFTYIIISIVDAERTGIYNSIPSSIILSIGTVVVLKLLFYTKPEQIEIRRYTLIFLTIICWTIGELIYVYYQTFAGIAVPYPSIADLFYLSATVFLSFHLYGVLHAKKNFLKTKYFVYLGFVASIFPIYLLFDGKGVYRDPEFDWFNAVAPTSVLFFNSGKLGDQYQSDLFIGSAKKGTIYHFDLNENRTHGRICLFPLHIYMVTYSDICRVSMN